MHKIIQISFFLFVNNLYSQNKITTDTLINLNDTNGIHVLSIINHENIEWFNLGPSYHIIRKVTIYDQWGVIVFETDKMDNFYWDGKNKNGSPLNEGVYYCVLLLRDNKTTLIRHFNYMN